MSLLFKPIQAQLHAADGPGRQLTIEPILSLGINADGWHDLGIYQLYDDMGPIGRIIFKDKTWWFEGDRLSETEQEELAFLIRFYDGAAA